MKESAVIVLLSHHIKQLRSLVIGEEKDPVTARLAEILTTYEHNLEKPLRNTVDDMGYDSGDEFLNQPPASPISPRGSR